MSTAQVFLTGFITAEFLVGVVGLVILLRRR